MASGDEDLRAESDDAFVYHEGKENKKYDCVDRMIRKLDIDMAMQSSPALFEDILAEDMHLADLPEAMALFETEVVAPVSLAPMLGFIRESIVTRQPELNTFL